MERRYGETDRARPKLSERNRTELEGGLGRAAGGYDYHRL